MTLGYHYTNVTVLLLSSSLFINISNELEHVYLYYLIQHYFFMISVQKLSRGSNRSLKKELLVGQKGASSVYP